MQDPPPLPYLTEKVSKHYDVSLEVFQRTFICMYIDITSSFCKSDDGIFSQSFCFLNAFFSLNDKQSTFWIIKLIIKLLFFGARLTLNLLSIKIQVW